MSEIDYHSLQGFGSPIRKSHGDNKMTEMDKVKIKAIARVLKHKFQNLNVEETLDLAMEILTEIDKEKK